MRANDPKEMELVRRLYDGPAGPDGIRIHYATPDKRSREDAEKAARELEAYCQAKEQRKREKVLAEIRERMNSSETRRPVRQRIDCWRRGAV